MVGGFEFADRLVLGVGAVVEAAVGERAAQPFVEEEKEQRNLNPFGDETIGVAGAVALQQPMGFELSRRYVLSERSKVVMTAWWICLAVQPGAHPSSLGMRSPAHAYRPGVAACEPVIRSISQPPHGSLVTRPWRKPDSNSPSHLNEKAALDRVRRPSVTRRQA